MATWNKPYGIDWYVEFVMRPFNSDCRAEADLSLARVSELAQGMETAERNAKSTETVVHKLKESESSRKMPHLCGGQDVTMI